MCDSLRDKQHSHAAGIASDGSRRMVGARHNIKPYPLSPEPAGKLNVTDPDSRNLKTTRGWVQGYNAQAVVGEGQIVLAADISTESLDTANLQPMIEQALDELARAGVNDTPDAVLADAGYWKNDAIEALNADGIPTLVAPDAEPAQRRRGPVGAAGSTTMRDRARDRPRRRALPQTPADDRARVRPDQVQPRRGPLPTPRPLRRQIGMAADHRNPQPPGMKLHGEGSGGVVRARS